MSRLVVLLLSPLLLSGCSALILSTGTHESRIISPASTATLIEEKLNAPLRVVVFDNPVPLELLRRTEKDLVVFAAATPETPSVSAVRMAEYAFHGRLRRDEDIREAIGMDVVSLGLAEAFYFPWSVAERAWSRDYVLVVWFSGDDRPIAYRWQRKH